MSSNQNTIEHFFSHHLLFQSLVKNKKIFQDLLRQVKIISYKRSEHIYNYAEKSKFVYVVKDGEIHIIQPDKSINNQAKLLGIQRHGSIFGEVSYLSRGLHSANAIASIDSNIFLIPGELFIKFIEVDSKIASHMLQLLSSRLRQNLSDDLQEYPSKLYSLFYPEEPERGTHLSLRIANILQNEISGEVLLITMNKEFKNAKASLRKIMELGMENITPLLQSSKHPMGFTIVSGVSIYSEELNLNQLIKKLPELLGYFRKYYDRILIDTYYYNKNPFIESILLQSDNVILVRNANIDKKIKNENHWQNIVTFATNKIENFFDSVVVISDNCTARGGKIARPINTFSALYKSHFNLNTRSAISLLENQEKSFIRGLHRIVRKINDTARGIALSGGGAKSIAHVGVLDVLIEEGIDFDGISGTSMGGIIGALYAMGKDKHTMLEVCKRLLTKKNMFKKTLPIVSFYKSTEINHSLIQAFAQKRFEDLEINFFCTATDLRSGQLIIFEKGYLSTALRASISLPGIFPPVNLGSYRLVDGAVLNNIPGDILKEKGFKKLIGVNVSLIENEKSLGIDIEIEKNIGTFWKGLKNYFSLPPIINIISRSLEIQSEALMEAKHYDFDYILAPKLSKIKLFDFDKIDYIYEVGRKTAIENLDNIKNSL